MFGKEPANNDYSNADAPGGVRATDFMQELESEVPAWSNTRTT